MVEWQPIETAPKDRSILACGHNFDDPAEGYHIAIVSWVQDGFLGDATGEPHEFLVYWMDLPLTPDEEVTVTLGL